MLIDKIKATIQKHKLLEKYDKILVGLSGGPDSAALLFSLYLLKKELMIDLYAAHLDHKFRGKESEGDRKFCEEFSKSLDIPIVCEEIDVPGIAKEKGISSEEAARMERYSFFKRVAAKKKIRKIAVGHNREDQAETVLMRVIRGAGVAGLGGMKFSRTMGNITIIRPLMEVSRKEIEEFVKENNLSTRHDSSNDELVFTRNKVRHELMPLLEEKFNPNIKEGLVNISENLQAENDFIEKFSRRKFKSISRKNSNEELMLDLKKLKKQDEAVKKRIIRIALEEIKGNLRRFTYQHWKEVEELIKNRPSNSIVDLPGGINIVKKRGLLIVAKE